MVSRQVKDNDVKNTTLILSVINIGDVLGFVISRCFATSKQNPLFITKNNHIHRQLLSNSHHIAIYGI